MDPAKTTRAGSPKRQQGARRIVARLAEAALAVDLVILMATAIVEEVAHEWFGMALFALAIGHVCLRWPIVRATFLGKASVRKFVTLALYLLILACLVALFASSLILSKFAFGWLPALPGASWARGLHMVASYWLFVLAFVHIGMSMRIFAKTKHRKTGIAIWLVACVALAVLGMWAFVDLDMWQYMSMGVQFAFADASAPLWATCAEFAIMGLGFAAIGNLAREATACIHARERG